jgi:mycothiol synthase
MGGPGSVVRVVDNELDWQSAVRRVVAAAAEADGQSPLNEDALLFLAHHGLQEGELHLADDGFAFVHKGNLDLVVSPQSRNKGVGGALLEAVSEGPLTAWSHSDHPAAAALAASHGFARVRELWRMRRPGGPVESVQPPVPIRAFRAGDEQVFLAVNAAAFADHPEQGSLTLEGLRERMAEPWFDPDGFFLAERDGEVVGFHWTKVHPDGTGEVYVIGIAPEAQGLGLGRALVTAGLAHLQPRDVLLYVEGVNAGAIGLYESLGFDHVGTDVQYRRR